MNMSIGKKRPVNKLGVFEKPKIRILFFFAYSRWKGWA
jgi:hypothetical protein